MCSLINHIEHFAHHRDCLHASAGVPDSQGNPSLGGSYGMSSNAGYALVHVNLFPPPNTRINEFMLGNITAEMRGETQMKDEKEGKKKKGEQEINDDKENFPNER